LPPLRRDARVDLVWCADAAPGVAARTAKQFGMPHSGVDYERLLDEHPVDAVSICTPHNAHYAAAMAAISRGAHVCCEKPLGLSLAEAEALTDAADATGIRGMVAYSYRFLPVARLLKELTISGEFGDLLQVHGLYAQAVALNEGPMTWRFQKSASGSGALADLCSHLLHLILWWAGDVRRLCAQLQTVVRERPIEGGGTAPVDVDDVCTLMGECESGAVFQLTASRISFGHKNTQRIEISGTRGAALYQNKSRHLRVCIGKPFPKSQAWELASPAQRLIGRTLRRAGRAAWTRVCPPPGCRAEQMTHFIDAIAANHPPETDFLEGVRVHKLMEAALASAETGQWVEVGHKPPHPAPMAPLTR
jgi:predicted dehydrogenase